MAFAPPPTPRGLGGLPSEVLLHLANNLSQQDLDNFVKADLHNRSLQILKKMTFGSRSFAPWRRRWGRYTQAYEAALREAQEKAWEAGLGNVPAVAGIMPSTIVNSNQVLKKGKKNEKEMAHESMAQDLFRDYGFPPPSSSKPTAFPRESHWRDPKCMKAIPTDLQFPEVTEGLVFEAIGRVFAQAGTQANRTYLRLKSLGCETPALLEGLEATTRTPIGLVQKIISSHDLKKGLNIEQCYRLITAYLMYTSLMPSQLPRIIERATLPERRDALSEERDRAIVEYFCFLGLWMDLWEAQMGILRYPRGYVPPSGIFTEQNRRVLSGRLKECLQVSFAATKPIMKEPVTSIGMAPHSALVGRTETVGSGKRMQSLDMSAELEIASPVESSGLQRSYPRGLKSVGDYSSQPPTNRSIAQEPASTLTLEQQKVVDTDVGPGELMKVRAYAGTGKTRCLVEYAKRRPGKKFLYVAFNKSARLDAEGKFGDNVICRTVHALAYKFFYYVALRAAAAKDNGAMEIRPHWGNKDLTKLLKLDNETVITNALKNPADHNKPSWRKKRTTTELTLAAMAGYNPTQESSKKPWPTAALVATTVRLTLERFWRSADRNVEMFLPHGLINKLGLKSQVVLQWVERIWNDILNARAPWLPHDAYLKLLQVLGEETEGDRKVFGDCDVIMFDEAQDANPCMASIILRQQLRGIGLIVVGDPYQCIYGFRGAENEVFDDAKFPAIKTHYLTWSFRFGDGVASVANTLLRALGEKVPVNGARQEDTVHAAQPLEEVLDDGMDLDMEPEISQQPFTVIFRKNITLVKYAITFAILHPYHKLLLRIRRDLQGATLFIRLREAYELLHEGKTAKTEPLKPWKTWDDLKSYVEAEEEEGNTCHPPILAILVQLEPLLLEPRFLEHLATVEANVLDDSEQHLADVILIAVHQAKGLEWDRVVVADDFKPDYGTRDTVTFTKYLRDEVSCFYVAITRARKELLLSAPMTAWIAGCRGWRRTFYEMAQARTEAPCCFCNRGDNADERNTQDPLKNVLIRSEDVMARSMFLLGEKARASTTTVMCLKCAKTTMDHWVGVGVEGHERGVVAGLVQSFLGTNPVEAHKNVRWVEREAWGAVWKVWSAAETKRVERWVGDDMWMAWWDARVAMIAQ